MPLLLVAPLLEPPLLEPPLDPPLLVVEPLLDPPLLVEPLLDPLLEVEDLSSEQAASVARAIPRMTTEWKSFAVFMVQSRPRHCSGA